MDGVAQEARIKAQAEKHLKAIGCGISPQIIESLFDYAQDAVLDEFYQTHSQINFWYQALDKSGWELRARPVADLWVEVGEHRQFSLLHLKLIVAEQR